MGAGLSFIIGESVSLMICIYFYYFRLHPIYKTRIRVPLNRMEAKFIFAES